jgi:hypothetical protein
MGFFADASPACTRLFLNGYRAYGWRTGIWMLCSFIHRITPGKGPGSASAKKAGTNV